MRKKFLSWVLALSIIISFVPVINVSAATSGSCGDNVTWTLDDNGTLTISGIGPMTNYSETNKAPWFNNTKNIQSIIIEKGVTTISNYAFYWCNSVISITIPDSITSIGDNAFYDCSKLTNITIPDSVTNIGYGAFQFCRSLTSIIIPGKVTNIKSWTFSHCNQITNITIPDSVTSIEGHAFSGCSQLENITIPKKVTSIADGLFCDCSSLTSVIIPEGVTNIGNNAFQCCWKITSITIPNSVTSIESNAFYDCSCLKSITIPDSVTSIGDRIFYNCHKLTNVTISTNIANLGIGMFQDCISLTNITIPNNITSIGDNAFYGCSKLANIRMPDNITSIGSSAFEKTAIYNNTENWENGVLYVGNYLIYNTNTIDSDYVVKTGTKTIADCAFYRCNELNSITLPDSVTNIGYRAFYSCNNLSKIIFNGNAAVYGNASFDNVSSSAIVYYYEGKTGFENTYAKIPTEMIGKLNVKSNISSGSVSKSTQITLSVNKNTPIYYTTDGTEPTTASAVYSGAITINKPMTIKAKSVYHPHYDSDILILAYHLKNCELLDVLSSNNEKITDTTISLSTNKDYMDFSAEVSDYATYGIFSDKDCTNGIDSKLLLNHGNNTFYVKVTAEDGVTSKTYTMNIKQLHSACDITSVTNIQKTLINDDIISCSVTQDNITPTFEVSENATYKLYLDSECKNSTDSFSLNHGNNTFYIKVTAEDGVTSKIYTMNIYRINTSCDIVTVTSPQNAEIKNDVVSCTLELDNITPTFEVSENATYELYLDSGCKNKADSFSLNHGNNTFYAKVTAEDNITAKIYTIKFNKVNSECDIISVSGIKSAEIKDDVISCTEISNNIIPTFEVSEYATYVMYSDEACTNQVSSLTLNYGNNTFYVKITAENGVTSKVYTVNIYRINTSCDIVTVTFPKDAEIKNNVISCTVALANITPTFKVSDNATYELYLDSECKNKADSFSLNHGNNTFYVKVTAEDGVTSKVYTININKMDSVCDITSVTNMQNVEINNDCVSGTTTFNTIIPEIGVSDNATYAIYSNEACTNEINSLNLTYGNNTFYVKVTAEDSVTSKTYTMNVYRPQILCNIVSVTVPQNAEINNSVISCMVTSNIRNIVPEFSVSDNATYATYSNEACTNKINSLNLSYGNNTFYVKVTAEDGVTSKIYTMNVYRPQILCNIVSVTVPQNAEINNNVISCTITSNSISPEFNVSKNATYELYLDLECKNRVDSFSLNYGSNTFYIKVTAEDGITARVYTMNVYRPQNACEIVSVTVPQNAEINNSIISCAVTSNSIIPKFKVSKNATYAVYSDKTCINRKDTLTLNNGNNIFYIKVTAENGITSKVYTMNIYKKYSTATLSSVTLKKNNDTFKIIVESSDKTSVIELDNKYDNIEIIPHTEDNATYRLIAADNEINSPYDLNVGANILYVEVISESGLNRNQYAINIVRKEKAAVPNVNVFYNNELNPHYYAKENSVFTLSNPTYDSMGEKYTIYYTVDGTMPTKSSSVYSGIPVSITKDVVVKAYLSMEGKTDSDIITVPIYVVKDISLTTSTKTENSITFDLTDKIGTKTSIQHMDSVVVQYATPVEESGNIQWETARLTSPITDTTTQVTVKDLKENTTYLFRLYYESGSYNGNSSIVEETTALLGNDDPTPTPIETPTPTPDVTDEPTPDVTSSPTATPTIEPTAEPTPTPTPEPISTLKITGVDRRNRVIKGIKVEGDTNTENAIGIVALYNSDGTLKQLETTKSNTVIHDGTYEINHSIKYDNDKDICKVFVWKGFDSLKPLATVYNVPPYEYSVETICKANNLENMTIDDAGYIYYVKDNIIYKCEVETGNKAEYFNPEGLEYLYNKARLSNFDIDNIVYNNYSDKIYMFGHYTEKDYEELLCNYAVYEITNQTADFIYFSKTYGYVKDYCGIVMPVDEDTAYVYSENSMSTSITDNSVWFDLNDGTYRRAGTAFKNNYIFKADGEYYDFYYIGRQLRFIGSSSATEATDVDGAKAIDNANLNFAYPNNTQGFVAYNEKLYYAGETSGDIYCMDLEGFKNKYIYSSDVYQHGDNTVDVSYYAYLQYFNMDYNGLPIWYDEAQGTIKRYKKN